MPSLQNIADAVGVSKSLVSKVLNDRLGTTRIRPDLIQRIRRKAGELGYRKNRSAEALSTGRQNTIGVFIQASGVRGSGIVEGLIDSVTSANLASGRKLLMSFFRDPAEFEPLAALIHPNIMDGVIVGGFCHPQVGDLLRRMRRDGLPLVTMFKHQVADIPNVGVRQEEVTRLATEHLIERGCRRIAHIYDTDERLSGYRQALAKHGLRFSAARVYEGPSQGFSHQRGELAAAHFMRSGVSFDGVVAQSDEEAVGVINVLHAAGRQVPGDVRVTGVDDAVYSRFNFIPITSVSERVDLQGGTAMRMLEAAMRGERIETQWLEPHLHPRRSSE